MISECGKAQFCEACPIKGQASDALDALKSHVINVLVRLDPSVDKYEPTMRLWDEAGGSSERFVPFKNPANMTTADVRGLIGNVSLCQKPSEQISIVRTGVFFKRKRHVVTSDVCGAMLGIGGTSRIRSVRTI